MAKSDCERRWQLEISRARREGDVDTLLHAVKYEKTSSDLYLHSAIRGLGEIGDVRAVDLVSVYLTSPVPRLRWSAAAALGRLGDARACDEVATLLSDDDHVVRGAACQALVQLDCPRRAELLRTRLGDPNDRVRGYVAEALAAIGDIESLPDLRSARRSEHGLFGARRKLDKAIVDLERLQAQEADPA